MQLTKWRLQLHSRKAIACTLALIMLFSMLGPGNPGIAMAKSGESYPATEFAVNINDNGEIIPVHTYTIAEMEALSVSDAVYYSSIDSMPAPVITIARGVTLSDLVADINAEYNADVNISPSTLKSIRLYCTDDVSTSYTYNYLFGSPRYYYPRLVATWDFNDGQTGDGCTDNPVAVEPMFAVYSFQDRFLTDLNHRLDGPTDEGSRTFRFCFGQTENDITNNTISTGRFSRWVNRVDIILPDGPDAPELSPDITDNNVGKAVEIIFDESEITWKDAIHIVRVDGTDLDTNQYKVNAGKITINSSVFSQAKDYTIYVKARNYKAATVTQTMQPGTNPELKTPPTLIADSSDNIIGNPIDITFSDNEAWCNIINEVKVGETVLEKSKYSISNKITINEGVFSTAGTYTIVIKATGYLDASVNQQILDDSVIPGTSKYELTPVEDTNYTVGVTPDGIKTMTVNSDSSGMKCFNVQVTPVTGHEGLENVVFTHWRDGTQLTINVTRADFDNVQEAKAGFNVQPGDIIKVYIVDQLSNDIYRTPVPFQ